MKKNTTKPTTSPAPATKPVTAKSAARKKTPTTASAKSAPAAKPAPLQTPSPAVVRTVPVQAVEQKPVATVITAKIDVGFGNTLYLRGEGAGLSWDAGLPMECVADDLWRISLGESGRGFTFKFLVNDLAWSVGSDYTAPSGASVTLVPEF